MKQIQKRIRSCYGMVLEIMSVSIARNIQYQIWYKTETKIKKYANDFNFERRKKELNVND